MKQDERSFLETKERNYPKTEEQRNLEEGRKNLKQWRNNLEEGRNNLEQGRNILEQGRNNLEVGRILIKKKEERDLELWARLRLRGQLHRY